MSSNKSELFWLPKNVGRARHACYSGASHRDLERSCFPRHSGAKIPRRERGGPVILESRVRYTSKSKGQLSHVFNMDAAATDAAAETTERSEGERVSTESDDTSTKEGAVRSKVLPLNSQRLTAALLKMIAHAMSLPTSVPADELRQLIDGKLIAMGKEPGNVQVLVTGTGRGEEHPALQGEDGIFVDTSGGGAAGVPTAEDASPGVEDAGLGDGNDTLEELRSRLEIVMRENKTLKEKLAARTAEGTEMTEALDEQTQRVTTLQHDLEAVEAASSAHIKDVTGELEREKERERSAWRLNCQQIACYDTQLNEKESEIATLNIQLEAETTRVRSREDEVLSPREAPRAVERLPSSLRGTTDHVSPTGPIGSLGGRSVAARSAERRGKAPPVDPFNGEKPDLRLDDLLPNLERAALWNGWTDDELLLQFAGHLRGRALLEWNLLDREEKSSYKTATDALRTRLDLGGRALAAQDFRHTFQRDNELVGDLSEDSNGLSS